MFGVNMTFISSSEVKKCIFHGASLSIEEMQILHLQGKV